MRSDGEAWGVSGGLAYVGGRSLAHRAREVAREVEGERVMLEPLLL